MYYSRTVLDSTHLNGMTWEVVTINTGSKQEENGEYYEIVFHMDPQSGQQTANLPSSAILCLLNRRIRQIDFKGELEQR